MGVAEAEVALGNRDYCVVLPRGCNHVGKTVDLEVDNLAVFDLNRDVFAPDQHLVLAGEHAHALFYYSQP